MNEDWLRWIREKSDPLGVRWQFRSVQAEEEESTAPRVGPGDWLVFARSLRPFVSKIVQAQTRVGAAPVTCCCAAECQPLSRLLVLHDDRAAEVLLLQSVARLCQCLRATPVVLTLARSERAARRRQGRLQTEAMRAGLAAEFDFFAGAEAATAVIHIARWRHCQAVLRQRWERFSWWWRADPLEELMERTDAPLILEVPSRGSIFEQADLPWLPSIQQPQASGASPRWGGSLFRGQRR
jgi:hypothetical protein